MKKKFAEQLVAALRSGDYKQGQGYLKLGDSYCCLGVACVIGEAKEGTVDGETFFNGQRFYLPDVIKKKGGFFSSRGERKDGRNITLNGKEYLNLSYLNDLGIPFSVIADYIEKNYKQL